MAGQSASLTLKEAKAMQEAIQHPCSQAKCGGSHAMDHNAKKQTHQDGGK